MMTILINIACVSMVIGFVIMTITFLIEVLGPEVATIMWNLQYDHEKKHKKRA